MKSVVEEIFRFFTEVKNNSLKNTLLQLKVLFFKVKVYYQQNVLKARKVNLLVSNIYIKI